LTEYWGHSYTWIGWDELGLWASSTAYLMLKGRLRCAQYPIPNMRIRSSANPGGAGHQWVKAYFRIDQHPMGGVIFDAPDDSGMRRLYVKSRLQDNKIGMFERSEIWAAYERHGLAAADQGLEGRRLERGGRRVLPRIQRCPYVAPIELPAHWTRFRAMDWGSAKPFSVGWYAVSDGELPQFPRGALIKYREWYGMVEGQPNTGLKMTATEVGRGIVSRGTKGEVLSYALLDPSAFAEDGGPSIARKLSKAGAVFRAADNKRVTQRGAMGGWDQVRGRLKGEVKPCSISFRRVRIQSGRFQLCNMTSRSRKM